MRMQFWLVQEQDFPLRQAILMIKSVLIATFQILKENME